MGNDLISWPLLDDTDNNMYLDPLEPPHNPSSIGSGNLDSTPDMLANIYQDPKTVFPPSLDSSSTNTTPEEPSTQSQFPIKCNADSESDNSPVSFTPATTNSNSMSPQTQTPKSNAKSTKPTKKSAKPHPSSPQPSKIQKRELNTLAARRYRQKRVDQMAELEAQLKESNAERDALKVRVARLEGEVDVLRGLLRQ